MARSSSGKFTKQEATEVRDQVSKTTIASIQEKIAKTQNETIRTLSQVQEQVVTALNELEVVKKAIEVEREESERIHGVAAIALEREEAEQQLSDRKADIERDLNEFQRNINEQKAAAQREYAETVRQNTEAADRAKAAWAFEFSNKQRDENNAWEETKRRRNTDEAIRQEQFERNLKDREAQMAAKEKEFNDLKAKVEAFPAELSKAVKTEVAIVTNSLTRDHKHEIELTASRFAADKSIADSTITNLRNDIANKDKAIEALQLQLTAANTKVETIATKALDTAGNVKALADIQALNSSQANNGAKRA